jgi:hypothetical protein
MSSSTVARGPLCRVLLSNGSTTVVPIKSSETIQQLVARLLDKRGLMYSAFEVYTDKHPKVCSFFFYAALITSLVITLFIFCLKFQLVIDSACNTCFSQYLFPFFASINDNHRWSLNYRIHPPHPTPILFLFNIIVVLRLFFSFNSDRLKHK